MSGGSGSRGRGSSPTSPRKRKRSLSPTSRRKSLKQESPDDSSKQSSSRRSSTTTDNRSGRPPTKQYQRRYTMSARTPPRDSPPARPRTVWPTVGSGEMTTQEHHDAVWETWNIDKLKKLWDDLADQEPHRKGLIHTVQRQLIRAQLYTMMGGGIPNQTLANIQIDGSRRNTTKSSKAGEYRQADRRRTDGSYREREVWNASLHDTEVGTIRDIKAWADDVSKQRLQDAEVVVIDLVGTTGPCEACKTRLEIAADDIMDGWGEKHNMTRDELPELRIRSYYGNPPEKLYPRGEFNDVRNGWLNDPTPGDLTFTNRKPMTQLVREHNVISVNTKPPVVPPTITVPITITTEKSKSEDVNITDV